jgi:hypothetical protein
MALGTSCQTVAKSVGHDLRPVLQVELLEDVLQVELYRVFAEGESAGYLLITKARGEQG